MSLLSERFEKSPRIRQETFACEMPIRCAASCWVRPRRRTARVISIARPDLIFSCSGWGSPRSRKTFPELTSNSMPLVLRVAISDLLRDCLGRLEPDANRLHVLYRCTDSSFALLLKAVQDENGFLIPDGVNSAVRPVRIVFNQLQHSSASKPFQHLGCIVPFAVLSKM